MLLLNSRGHTLLMWCWLASLTCCGGREPCMPLRGDRSPRRCWRWTAPASGRCHHSLQRKQHSSDHRICTFLEKKKQEGCGLWVLKAGGKKKTTTVEWIAAENTQTRNERARTKGNGCPPTVFISIKAPALAVSECHRLSKGQGRGRGRGRGRQGSVTC